MKVKTITRKWGNSIAIVIPKDLAKARDLGPNEDVMISIDRERPSGGMLFGTFPELRQWPTQQLKDEARAGWESEADRKEWK